MPAARTGAHETQRCAHVQLFLSRQVHHSDTAAGFFAGGASFAGRGSSAGAAASVSGGLLERLGITRVMPRRGPSVQGQGLSGSRKAGRTRRSAEP